MNMLRFGGIALLLALVSSAPLRVAFADPAAEAANSLDLRRAVPVEAYLAVYGQHNPERDYQRKYLEDVWQTVKDERLVERVVELVTANVPDENMQQARGVFDELKKAVEPVDWQALADSDAVAYAAVMELPSAQHLLMLRMTPDGAAGCEAAVKNLFADVERLSEGKVPVATDTEGSVELTSLGLPPKVPFHPTVARIDGVFIFSTSEALVRRSVGMLQGSDELSKFDDPRLKEALGKLPAPEDALVFFDGRQLVSSLAKIGPFIREQKPGDEDAAHAADVIEGVIDQFRVFDYAITSEYTEGTHNCAETLVKMLPDVQDKVLTKMVASGEPFDKWQSWVPADATAYSLSTGASLHPLYEMIVKLLHEDIPDGDKVLDQFNQLQDQLDIHLDADIFQSFSGENVSVTLPPTGPSAMGGPDGVLALRCEKPDRVRELLHRAVEALQKIPAVKAQQLALAKCDELEGFEKLSLTTLAMFGAEPVIGFQDGWMIVGSRAAAVQRVLDTRSGSAPTAADSEQFKRFDVDVHGPVNALSYTDLAASTHQSANSLRQFGMIAPMIIGMAGAQADAKDLQPVLDAIKLLPSIAKVIDKFDYFEAKLTVTQAGDEPGTYVCRSVTLVRPPAEDQSAEPASGDSQPAAATDDAPADSN